MAYSLLDTIRTLDDRDEVLGLIDVLLNSLYQKKDGGFDSILESRIPMHYAESIRADLATNQEDPETYLKSLQKSIQGMEVVTIGIAFLPSYASISTISSFVKHEYGQNCVLEIKYDPNLIAGATVSYKGIYSDYTVRKQFESTIANLKTV